MPGRHARGARDLAHADRLEAALVRERDRGLDQALADLGRALFEAGAGRVAASSWHGIRQINRTFD